MKSNFSTEFVFQLFALIVAIIIVHTIYVGIIRPNAVAILEEQQIQVDLLGHIYGLH